MNGLFLKLYDARIKKNNFTGKYNLQTSRVKPFNKEDIETFKMFLASVTDNTFHKAIFEQWFITDHDVISARHILVSVTNECLNNEALFNVELHKNLTPLGLKKIKRIFSKYKSAKSTRLIKISKNNHEKLQRICNEFGFESIDDSLEHLLDPDESLISFLVQ